MPPARVTTAGRERKTDAIASVFRSYIRTASFGWSALVFALALAVIFPLQKVALPYLASSCIRLSSAARPASNPALKTRVVMLCGTIAVVFATRILMYYTGLHLQNVVNLNARQKVVDRVLRAHRYSTHNPKVSNWITHVENVTGIVQLVFCKFINTIVPEIVSFLTIGVFFAWIDVQIGMAYALALLVVGVTFVARVSFSQRAAMRDYRQRLRINDRVQNVLHNMPYIRAAGAHGFEKSIIRDKMGDLREAKHAFLHTNTRFLAALDLAVVVFVCWCLYRLYRRLGEGERAAGAPSSAWIPTTFIVLLIFVKDFDDFKKTLTEIFNFSYTTALFDEMVGADAARDRRNMRESVPPPRRASVPQRPHQTAVVLQDIELQQGGRAMPIRPITARFKHACVNGVRGRSGIGKSTLAYLIAGVMQPRRGRIWIHGKNATNDLQYRRSHTVFMPQHAQLFNGTLYDNIVYADVHSRGETRTRPATPAWTKARVHALLDESGLAGALQGNHDASASTAYLDRRVVHEGSNLSGGQKQIVMYARTLISAASRHKSTVYVLDEPHASLDPKNERLLLQGLRKLARRGNTVILITHSVAAMRYCDTTLYLNEK